MRRRTGFRRVPVQRPGAGRRQLDDLGPQFAEMPPPLPRAASVEQDRTRPPFGQQRSHLDWARRPGCGRPRSPVAARERTGPRSPDPGVAPRRLAPRTVRRGPRSRRQRASTRQNRFCACSRSTAPTPGMRRSERSRAPVRGSARRAGWTAVPAATARQAACRHSPLVQLCDPHPRASIFQP